MRVIKYEWCGIGGTPSVFYCVRCETTEDYDDNALVRDVLKQFAEFQHKHKDCPSPCPVTLRCEKGLDHNGKHGSGSAEWWAGEKATIRELDIPRS